MTLENLKKLYKHFSFLSKGNFTPQDFNKEFGDGEDGGFMHMGKLTSDRKQLIIANATQNLKNLVKKYPKLEEEEVEEIKEVDKVKVSKSKGKK